MVFKFDPIYASFRPPMHAFDPSHDIIWIRAESSGIARRWSFAYVAADSEGRGCMLSGRGAIIGTLPALNGTPLAAGYCGLIGKG